MKAILYDGKDKLYIDDVKIPNITKNEVLIQVKYAGICRSDLERINNKTWDADRFPIIPGHEFMGVIIEVKNPEHEKLISGRVVVQPILSCGTCRICKLGFNHICENRRLFGIHINGGMAEYISVPIQNLHFIDEQINDMEAALIEPLAVAIHDVFRSDFKFNDSILITGAGTIGLLLGFILQIAGASNISFIEINQDRIDFAKNLGFKILKPTCTNKKNPIQYDIGFETSGSSKGMEDIINLIRKRGKIVNIGFHQKGYLLNITDLIFREIEIRGSIVSSSEDFSKATDIINSKKIPVSKLITKIFNIKDFKEAFAMALNKKSLKVLINIGTN